MPRHVLDHLVPAIPGLLPTKNFLTPPKPHRSISPSQGILPTKSFGGVLADLPQPPLAGVERCRGRGEVSRAWRAAAGVKSCHCLTLIEVVVAGTSAKQAISAFEALQPHTCPSSEEVKEDVREGDDLSVH